MSTRTAMDLLVVLGMLGMFGLGCSDDTAPMVDGGTELNRSECAALELGAPCPAGFSICYTEGGPCEGGSDCIGEHECGSSFKTCNADEMITSDFVSGCEL